VNIAVVKYWGKRDEKLVLPINSSLSGTIDKGSMMSQTTITASTSFATNEMFLNDKPVDMNKGRTKTVISLLQQRAQDFKDSNGVVVIKQNDWPNYRLRIVSHNNFPTAAGLASSASGFACMTAALAALYNVEEKSEGELSIVARQGSGSACRSMYGGYVKWVMGDKADGSDSIARQVAPASHWPQMRVLILVAGAGPKKIPSTDGMRATVATSELIQHRMHQVVPQRMKLMEKAICERDFKTFGDLTMRDSNQFHATCLDTTPPIFYLNETSKRVIELVHGFNACMGEIVAAYTFDAGPNAVIYFLDEHMPALMSLFLHYFTPGKHGGHPTPRDQFVVDKMKLSSVNVSNYEATLNGAYVTKLGSGVSADAGIRQIIVSKVGEGPEVIHKASSFQPKARL
jgi:diphosphomevalonate decarboxylase